MSLASLYSLSEVREKEMPHQRETALQTNWDMFHSSGREHSGAGLERRVDLELQVQEAAGRVKNQAAKDLLDRQDTHTVDCFGHHR